MCGLIGMYTSSKSGLYGKDADQLFHLMLLNSVRGAHSTGLAGINLRVASTEADIVKTIGNPYNLNKFEDFATFEKRIISTYSAIIGHGRYATQGAINAVNAHPFKEGRIVLAHNGVIRNYTQLNAKYDNKYPVDSQLIAHMFNDIGVEETLKQVEGAFVFMWFDTLEGTFNIVRNSERPLFMGKSKYGDSLVFSSEKETLEWNASRNKAPLDSIEEIPVGVWHVWDGLSVTPEKTEVELKKYTAYYPITTTGRQTTPTGYTPPAIGSRVYVDQIVTFDIENYFSKQQNTVPFFEVVGEHSANPCYKFVGKLWEESEEEIIESGAIRGKISNIDYSLRHGQDVWTCYVVGCSLVPKSVPDEEERVTLIDAVGSTRHSLTFHRVDMLASSGCVWCQSPIEADSVKNFPSRFSFWEGMSTSDSGLVCPSCGGLVADAIC